METIGKILKNPIVCLAVGALIGAIIEDRTNGAISGAIRKVPVIGKLLTDADAGEQ